MKGDDKRGRKENRVEMKLSSQWEAREAGEQLEVRQETHWEVGNGGMEPPSLIAFWIRSFKGFQRHEVLLLSCSHGCMIFQINHLPTKRHVLNIE